MSYCKHVSTSHNYYVLCTQSKIKLSNYKLNRNNNIVILQVFDAYRMILYLLRVLGFN